MHSAITIDPANFLERCRGGKRRSGWLPVRELLALRDARDFSAALVVSGNATMCSR
jgi:hypothetical protein